MIKEHILKVVRLEIQEIAEELTYENLSQSRELINRYIQLMENVKDIPFARDAKEAIQPELQYEEECEELKEDEKREEEYCDYTPLQIKEVFDTKNNIYLGQLELKLQGGEIGSFKLYIPEKTIRELGCQNGDWIQASSISNKKMPDGSVKVYYDYKLVQKAEEPAETKRCDLKCVIVKYENVLRKYYVEAEYNGVIQKILLPERDVADLQIQEGDVVDYAYWKENILGGRIVWKHKCEAEEKAIPKINQKCTFEEKEDEEENISPIFKNKHIVVVGFESMKNIYREIIEKRGGKFSFFTGSEKSFNTEVALRYADAIIVFVEYVGHSGMFRVKSVSKTYDIPVSYTKKLGQESFIRLVKELIESKPGLDALSESV